MSNEIIKSKLISLKNNYRVKLESVSNFDKLLENLYQELKIFDFEAYKRKLEIEIEENLKEWWINPKKGIVKSEKLFAILFEFDNYYYMKNVEATSYGIGTWENCKVQTEEFDMGYDYDFTTEFYAAPGITMNFMDSLAKLDDSNLPSNYKNVEICKLEGHHELMELYKIEGFIAIHETLRKMDYERKFEELNYKNNFMFLIEEHDSGKVSPLLIKNK